jgi:hypothetical protein
MVLVGMKESSKALDACQAATDADKEGKVELFPQLYDLFVGK